MIEITRETQEKSLTVNGEEYQSMEELPEDIKRKLREQGIHSFDDFFKNNKGEKKKSLVLKTDIPMPNISRTRIIIFLITIVAVFLYEYSDLIISYFSQFI